VGDEFIGIFLICNIRNNK
jgi:hypothetical protein